VKEAIESIEGQTYKTIEIIVIDDNGKNSKYANGLKELCEKYQNVIYIANEVNSGAQVSRNKGILNAHGEYIAFLDDDDIWDKNKIEKQMLLFDRDSVGMVYCDGYSFADESKSKLSSFRSASLFEIPISYGLELFNDYIGSTSQALIKKECFCKIGIFDVEMPARQDYEMWLRISKEYEIIGVPEKLLYYRIHSGERISTNWEKCYYSYYLILKKYKNDYKKNRYAKSKLLLRLFSTGVMTKKYFMSIKFLMYAIITSPRCVTDVIKRHIQRKSFSDFYTIEYLRKIGII